MERAGRGYWQTNTDDLEPGSRYRFRLDGGAGLPDPASSFQPLGVHGPSALVDHSAFPWSDASWSGFPLARLVFYELHVGVFTPEGTFDAVIPRLAALRELGVTALELMPVAEFPGRRNWGYDPANPFAAHHAYGGPEGLKRLVDACHRSGLAVFLDVVMNHLGPEGNYLGCFGPYFTDRYRTPWGDAVNFDGPDSDEVRRYFLENALHWLDHYHVDGLRLDAIHAIHDESPRPFLAELSDLVKRRSEELDRPLHLIAESNRNDPRCVDPTPSGGLGLDAVWLDDFHHSLHALVTEEHDGYYADFGRPEQLGKCFKEGFAYSGEYSSHFRCRHGAPSRSVAGRRFVAFSQNHDQVGNRLLGERLSALVPLEALKLVAGAVLLSPFLPLLFMGEEYGEESPFLYFVDHGDPDLVRAVRDGRRAEFRSFEREIEAPDPSAFTTFERSRLRWEAAATGWHSQLRDFYRELLSLRRAVPSLATLDKDLVQVEAEPASRALAVGRSAPEGGTVLLLNPGPRTDDARLPWPGRRFHRLLDAAESRWGGPGPTLASTLCGGDRVVLSPYALALYGEEASS